MVELFANSEDPDQTPQSAASDLSLHCLPVTRLGVSSLQWLDHCTQAVIGWKLVILFSYFGDSLNEMSYNMFNLCEISKIF